jgi:hypothetical protein
LYGFTWGYVGYPPALLLQNRVSFLHKGGEFLSKANKILYEKLKDDNIDALSPKDFKSYRVKYVWLHHDINYEVFNYEKNYTQVKKELDMKFEKVITNDRFTIYETYREDLPVIEFDNSIFKEVNPTHFRLSLNKISRPSDLTFFNAFHKNWLLFLKRNDDWERNVCESIINYQTIKVTECKQEERFFTGDELIYLLKKSIFDDTHHLVNEYANGWTIDPKYIKQNFSKEYYKENPDGSIDIELVLYFKPQSYFYLGLLVSGTTLIGMIGYLVYSSLRCRKRKRLTTAKAVATHA